MAISIHAIIADLASNPRKIFLIDGIGAFVTTLLLSTILAPFSNFFGMPQAILYLLATVAFFYTLYSLSCFYFIPQKWQFCLSIILVANIFYCCLTTGFIFYYYPTLTKLGLIYFILEIAIMTQLILIEYQTIRLSFQNNQTTKSHEK